MAKISNSECFIATDLNEANTVAERFRSYISKPLLTQIQIKVEGFDAYDVTPSSIPDVFASRPILVFGKYKGHAKGKLTITGNDGNGRFNQVFNISDATLSKSNEALRYLWARKKIERLDDYRTLFGEDTKREVIELGLEYNLLTQYTSFVAVDNEIVNKKGKLNPVKQPLPMPMNVNNSAVGAEASIKGKSVIKSSTLDKSKARRWLKLNYNDMIQSMLKQYKEIRVHLDSDGTIIKVEALVNGTWSVCAELKRLFLAKEVAKKPRLSKKVTVTLKP